MTTRLRCKDCGKEFTLSAAVQARYPGWSPKQCWGCRNGHTEDIRTAEEVLAAYSSGPDTGVFTDGFCEPNPGRGGWGAVKVLDGKVVVEKNGSEPSTTNNRMELKALIEGLRLLDPADSLTVFSDSQLCINTLTKWAPAWQAAGWKRKGKDPIANLDLVKEAFDAFKARPNARLEWVKGHAGIRWNEYADALSRTHSFGQI